MAKLVCELCGFTQETPMEEGMQMSEIPKHCGQPMKIVSE